MTNTKTDLTNFSENELSMLVFNDEDLYKWRNSDSFLTGIIPSVYIYTDEQFEMLENDLAEEAEEIEREENINSQDVEETLASMMLTSTGTHMLDSGGSEGRQWQRNQKAMQDKNPVEYLNSLESVEVDTEGAEDSEGIDFTINIFHYLKGQLSLDSICYDFNELQKNSDNWDTDLNMYGVSEEAGNFLEHFELELSNPVNTYNHDSRLSQVLQYSCMTLNSEHYIALQIHQGADVRGGYTNAKLFKLDNEYCYDGGFLNPEDVYGSIIDEEEEYHDVSNSYGGYALTNDNGVAVPFNDKCTVELELSN